LANRFVSIPKLLGFKISNHICCKIDVFFGRMLIIM
jgi:hypothetical protein